MTDEAVLEEFIAQLDSASVPDSAIELRSLDKREIAMRIVPWEVPAITRAGPEVIMRGAFGDVDPSRIVLQLEHENPPAGKGISYEDRSDGAWMVFKVSKTQRGDDILTLAQDGVAAGASVTFQDAPGGVELFHRSGKTLRVVHQAALRAVSTTWLPTWQEAAVQSIRSAPEGVTQMPEAPVPQPETPAPTIDFAPLIEAIREQGAQQAAAIPSALSPLMERMAELEERSRKDIDFPGPAPKPDAKKQFGVWMDGVVKMMSGDRLPAEQRRTLDELITTDNLGVVPDAFLPELVGIIDASRPFLNSTRRLALPPAGMTLTVPKIITRPEVDTQAAEKDDIASNTTSITTADYNAITLAGGGDLSLQLLKRSSPSFLGLYLELLAESLSKKAEEKALAALYTADTPGGTLNPEDANFGLAWRHGAAVGVPPDTIWLSSTGMGAFIDAKASGTNAPLYSNISTSFTAGAQGGTISGLRPVYVPAMDRVGDVDAIVGPSRGFAWTEDGSYTLEVDVPAKAGRDVALVSMFWFAPLYGSAFTTYQMSS